MSEDARVEAAMAAYEKATSTFWESVPSPERIRLRKIAAMTAALAAADAVPGFTVVRTNDLRAVIARMNRSQSYWADGEYEAYDRLRAKAGQP